MAQPQTTLNHPRSELRIRHSTQSARDIGPVMRGRRAEEVIVDKGRLPGQAPLNERVYYRTRRALTGLAASRQHRGPQLANLTG